MGHVLLDKTGVLIFQSGGGVMVPILRDFLHYCAIFSNFFEIIGYCIEIYLILFKSTTKRWQKKQWQRATKSRLS